MHGKGEAEASLPCALPGRCCGFIASQCSARQWLCCSMLSAAVASCQMLCVVAVASLPNGVDRDGEGRR